MQITIQEHFSLHSNVFLKSLCGTLPFLLDNSRYFSSSGPAVCLLLQGAIYALLTTEGRASLCFRGGETTVRGVNDDFFSNVSLIVSREIIASTSLFKSAV